MGRRMNSFLTGSRAYGTSTESSDIDLVVLVDEGTKAKLLDLGGIPCRFGNLNLIPVTTDAEFECWKEATRQCVHAAKNGLSRDEAVAIHKGCRNEFSVLLITSPSGKA